MVTPAIVLKLRCIGLLRAEQYAGRAWTRPMTLGHDDNWENAIASMSAYGFFSPT